MKLTRIEPPAPTYSLTLDEREARILRSLVGVIGGGGSNKTPLYIDEQDARDWARKGLNDEFRETLSHLYAQFTAFDVEKL